MFTFERVAIALLVALLAACATQMTGSQTPPKGPNLGRAAGTEEIKAWDISIPPSGAGLPAGSGSVKQGAVGYTSKCQTCHGAKGAGKPADALVGGGGVCCPVVGPDFPGRKGRGQAGRCTGRRAGHSRVG